MKAYPAEKLATQGLKALPYSLLFAAWPGVLSKTPERAAARSDSGQGAFVPAARERGVCRDTLMPGMVALAACQEANTVWWAGLSGPDMGCLRIRSIRFCSSGIFFFHDGNRFRILINQNAVPAQWSNFSLQFEFALFEIDIQNHISYVHTRRRYGRRWREKHTA